MAYFLQIIVFILALFGVFFKSTQTDEEGKTLYSERGLPYLTFAGQIVVVLLTISFIISLFTIWSSSESVKTNEQAAGNKIEKLQNQNEDLKQQIARTLTPIRDIKISFEISVSLENPELENYRRRLRKGGEEYFSRERDTDGFLIPPQDPLFPKEDEEENSAFYIFNSTKLEGRIFKKKVDPKTYNKETPDIVFSLITYSVREEGLPVKAIPNRGGGLTYKKRYPDTVFIVASDLQTTIDKQSGNIVAVQDLLETQIVISVEPNEAYTLSDFYKKKSWIEFLRLNVSEGRYFRCKDEDIKNRDEHINKYSLGNTIYLCTLEELKK